MLLSTRTQHMLLAGVLLGSACLSAGMLRRGHNWGGDFATYVMQAESIVHGTMDDFAAHNRLTMKNSTRPVGPGTAPWGTPLILAPLYLLFGVDFLAFKLANTVFYLLFLLCFCALTRNRLPAGSRLVLVALLGFHPALLRIHDYVLSDIHFLFFSTAGLLLIDRVVLENRRIVSRRSDHCLVGIVAFAAYLVRPNGLLLLPTLLVSQIVEGCRRRLGARRERGGGGGKDQRAVVAEAAAGVAPYVVFALLLGASWWFLPPGDEGRPWYAGRIGVRAIRGNLGYYAKLPAVFFTGVPAQAVWYAGAIPFVFLGVARNLRRDYWLAVYCALTFSIYLIVRGTQGVRYILPALPLLVYFGVAGVVQTGVALPAWYGKSVKWVARVLGGVLLVVFAWTSAAAVGANLRQRRAIPGPFAPASQEMFAFVEQRTETGSVVIFFKPRVMRMFTGRDAVMIDKARQITRGDYLVYHRGMGRYDQVGRTRLDHLVSGRRLREIYRNAGFIVYRVVKAKRTGSQGEVRARRGEEQ